MDLTDAFDTRLEALQSNPLATPEIEIKAAIAVYERMRTARAICQALLSEKPSESAVLAVLEAIGSEVALTTSKPPGKT